MRIRRREFGWSMMTNLLPLGLSRACKLDRELAIAEKIRDVRGGFFI